MPLPAAGAPAAASAYAASSHSRHKSGGKGKLIALSMVGGIVLLAVAGIAVKMVLDNEKTATSDAVAASSGNGSNSAAAEPASSTIGATEAETSHGGWIGVQELFAEQATITIVTYADDSRASREFAADVAEPVSIASITIDNTRGKGNIALDTSGATLKLTDGSTRQGGDAGLVVATAKQNPELVKARILSPFTCPPGRKMTEKLLLLPHGTDARKLVLVKVRINGQEYDIIGSFSNDPRRVEQMRAGPAAPALPTMSAAPASRPS